MTDPSPDPDAPLDGLTDEDVMYDYPRAMSGEPMDPVLFVRWEAIRPLLRAARATKDTGDAGLLREAAEAVLRAVAAADTPWWIANEAEDLRAALDAPSTAGAESGLDREGTE